MITFRKTNDPFSMEIIRPGARIEQIGYLQWHTCRDPRIVITNAQTALTITEMKRAIEVLEKIMETKTGSVTP